MLCHGSLGGSSRVAAGLALQLSGRGHAVSLVSATAPAAAAALGAVRLEPLVRLVSDRPETTVEATWDAGRFAALERHVEAVVLREGVQVVHYHYAWPFAQIAARLKERLGPQAPAFVGTLHGTDVTDPPGGAATAALAAADLLTTVSRAYAELAQRRLSLARRPVVVPNFVEPADFPLSLDFSASAAGRRRPRLVHVSNYRAVKDPDGVARVFADLRRRLPAELWLVGDGPGLEPLVAALRRQHLADDVRVLGYRADVGQVLACCDLLLMTSLEESFCLAVLEAMAAGLCVVAPAVGGLPEVSVDGETALLFPAGDYGRAADLAARLLSDTALRLSLRRSAVRRAHAFSADRVVRRYEDLYRLVLSTTGAADVSLARKAV